MILARTRGRYSSLKEAGDKGLIQLQALIILFMDQPTLLALKDSECHGAQWRCFNSEGGSRPLDKLNNSLEGQIRPLYG
jgi:hypothetical protein